MSDGIVLVGLPGSGKSAVGRIVADRLDRPFIDLDTEVSRRAGRPPSLIIETEGEAAFRALEHGALEAACRVRGAVVAAGGGTPLDPLNRWLLMEHGFRVRLDVPLERLAARLDGDPEVRPLLGSDWIGGLRRTSEARSAVYRAVDAAIDGDAPADVVAGRVIAARAADAAAGDGWRLLYDGTHPRQHPLGPREGRIVFGRGLTRSALDAGLEPFAGRAPAVVADTNVLHLAPGLDLALPPARRLTFAGGEQVKSFDCLREVLAWLSGEGVERGDPLIVAGGGTIGDVAGLAAALHHRGMPLVHLPTTWLAQADSAHGGKVAIDLPAAKNAVGAFWPPVLTLVDSDLLATLPVERRRDGLAEVAKAALIGDAELWQLVEDRGWAALAGEDDAAAYAMTERAARLKLAIVQRDPFEAGERRMLNLGHTLGHALEVESGYELAHGAAVALGLRAVARIAAARGAEPELIARLDAVLASLGFSLRRRFDMASVRRALAGDKKRDGGRQRWILPLAIGRTVEVDDVSEDELEKALEVIWE